MQANLKMFNQIFLGVFLLILIGCNPADFVEENDEGFLFSESELEASRSPGSKKVDEQQFRVLQMQNRNYIASVLRQVFGPNYNKNSIVSNLIKRNQGAFGGACDIYAKSRRGETSTAIEFFDSQCFDPNWNTAPFVVTTTLREGWKIQACERIISENSQSVDYAFNKAMISGSESEPTEENLNNLYQLFYPLDVIDTDTSEFMLAEAKNFSSTEDFWEASLLTFCISPGWQTI